MLSVGPTTWTSKTNPAGAGADAHVIVNSVVSVPLVGLAVTGTATAPVWLGVAPSP